jgi:putative nucleotidyltransferase with HDIG domain
VESPVIKLLARLAREPGPATIHVVGGVVRDLLLDRAPRDIDILAEGNEEAGRDTLRRLSALAGMPPVLFDRRAPATHRVLLEGVIVDLSLCPPGQVRDALRRRDFTINAMAVRLDAIDAAALETGVAPKQFADPEQSLIDPFGGLADLRAGRLRATAPGALEEDPLRMLRAVRLEATLPGFRLTPELERGIAGLAPRIREAAAERISAEMDLAFESPGGGAAVRRMEGLGLLLPLLPELGPLRGLLQPPEYHDHDAFEHTIRAVEATDQLVTGHEGLGLPPLGPAEALLLRWAALLHDIGKAATATVDGEGRPHFYGHASVSASLAETALQRLRMPAGRIEPVLSLIRWHSRIGSLATALAGERPIRRLVRTVGDLLPLVILLSLADRAAAGGTDPRGREAAVLEIARRALAVRAEVAATAASPPLLTGREVIEILGIDPGPRVGTILRWLDRLRTEGRIGTRREAVDMLRSLPPPRIPE